MDSLKEFLKAILTQEDCEKYSVRSEPKKEETTIYKELPNKVKEQGKVLGQVEHHRNVLTPSFASNNGCYRSSWLATRSCNKRLTRFRRRLRLRRILVCVSPLCPLSCWSPPPSPPPPLAHHHPHLNSMN